MFIIFALGTIYFRSNIKKACWATYSYDLALIQGRPKGGKRGKAQLLGGPMEAITNHSHPKYQYYNQVILEPKILTFTY